MAISCFDDLIQAARAQPDPQRLLFVFTRVGPPENPTPEQAAAYRDGRGGSLIPLACVDRTPAEIDGFAELCVQAAEVVPDWSLVFVGALGGGPSLAPTSQDAEAHLDRMIEMIKTGRVAGLNAFDREGAATMPYADTDYGALEAALWKQPH